MGLKMAIVISARRKGEVVVNAREVRDQATTTEVCHDVPHCNLGIQACEMFQKRERCASMRTRVQTEKNGPGCCTEHEDGPWTAWWRQWPARVPTKLIAGRSWRVDDGF